MKTVIEKVKALKSVGHFPKDHFKGELAKQWNAKLKELEIDQVCGVVWCGVVWCGVVWCGVVWGGGGGVWCGGVGGGGLAWCMLA